MTTTSFDERAAAGAALLDTVMPKWDEKIDLAELDMASYGHCVGGQLCGTYAAFADMLGLEDTSVIPSFNPDLAQEENGPLTAAWRRLIAGRRFDRGALRPSLLAEVAVE
jgi:hypothetical protein